MWGPVRLGGGRNGSTYRLLGHPSSVDRFGTVQQPTVQPHVPLPARADHHFLTPQTLVQTRLSKKVRFRLVQGRPSALGNLISEPEGRMPWASVGQGYFVQSGTCMLRTSSKDFLCMKRLAAPEKIQDVYCILCSTL